jgi:hypothetical protein
LILENIIIKTKSFELVARRRLPCKLLFFLQIDQFLEDLKMMGRWILNLLTASILTHRGNFVTAFQFLPSGKVFQRGAFSPTNLRMVATRFEPSHEGERRVAEFVNLEPVTQTDARRARLSRDQETKKLFAEYGEELWALRKKIQNLGEKLVGVLNGSSGESEQLIRQELRELERRDPEVAYEMELLEMELARREGDMQLAEKSKHRALSARSCLPHYNLEGLWVGK